MLKLARFAPGLGSRFGSLIHPAPKFLSTTPAGKMKFEIREAGEEPIEFDTKKKEHGKTLGDLVKFIGKARDIGHESAENILSKWGINIVGRNVTDFNYDENLEIVLRNSYPVTKRLTVQDPNNFQMKWKFVTFGEEPYEDKKFDTAFARDNTLKNLIEFVGSREPTCKNIEDAKGILRKVDIYLPLVPVRDLVSLVPTVLEPKRESDYERLYDFKDDLEKNVMRKMDQEKYLVLIEELDQPTAGGWDPEPKDLEMHKPRRWNATPREYRGWVIPK